MSEIHENILSNREFCESVGTKLNWDTEIAPYDEVERGSLCVGTHLPTEGRACLLIREYFRVHNNKCPLCAACPRSAQIYFMRQIICVKCCPNSAALHILIQRGLIIALRKPIIRQKAYGGYNFLLLLFMDKTCVLQEFFLNNEFSQTVG